MNEVLEGLHSRKSVRVFTDQAVTPSDKLDILKAAAAAPTAGNQQLYTILDITSPQIKQTLVVTCDNQPFIAQAPLVFIFCADPKKWYDAYQWAGCDPRPLGVGDLMLAIDDALIAAQNAVTAAESLGLGSCYIGDIMERREEHMALLGLPPHVFPAAMLVMGYPTQQQKNRIKPLRLDMTHLVQENHYKPMGVDGFSAILGENGDPKVQLAAFCKRKYNSDFSREMTRSVAAWLAEFSL